MPEKLTGAEALELEQLDDLVRSKAWRVVRNIMNEHRLHCKDESHKYLKRHEDRKAGEWLARSEETQAILYLISERVKQLTSKHGGTE